MGNPNVPQEMHSTNEPGSGLVRYQEGWRTGKPVEDPDKLKSWGFVTAKPSEYLVVVKQGRIDLRRSGQGMRVWKWPWNAVAIVPTSLQQIDFVADQITRERVGVAVSGVAVYRIAQPEIAYRVLNFSYGESAKEKLAATLREMFIGAAADCQPGARSVPDQPQGGDCRLPDAGDRARGLGQRPSRRLHGSGLGRGHRYD